MPRRKHLPGLTHIYTVDCHQLPMNIGMMNRCGMPIAIYACMTEISFFGTATCSMESSYVSGGRQEVATLVFSSTEHIPACKPLAFVVTDVNDRSFIIGAREKPYPMIKATRQTGTPDGEPSCYNYEITHTSNSTMIECYM